MGPTINALAKEYDGKAVIGKLNVSESSDIAGDYNIRSIPALVFFKDGKEVDRMMGNQPKSAIASKLDNLIGG